MLGNFHPSIVANDIYDIIAPFEQGVDIYEYAAVDAVIDYFSNEIPHYDFLLNCANWPDETGGVCSISFCEDGYPQLVTFDYVK